MLDRKIKYMLLPATGASNSFYASFPQRRREMPPNHYCTAAASLSATTHIRHIDLLLYAHMAEDDFVSAGAALLAAYLFGISRRIPLITISPRLTKRARTFVFACPRFSLFICWSPPIISAAPIIDTHHDIKPFSLQDGFYLWLIGGLKAPLAYHYAKMRAAFMKIRLLAA